MIRQPPRAVPEAMATAQLTITHSGGSALAGSRTATLGRDAPVAIDVAIAFAVS
jgi:hypothetical protein